MSGGELYVVVRHYGYLGDGVVPGALFPTRKSEGEAIAFKRECDDSHPNWTHTVHKLGPAIKPPEPREWVVVSENGRISPKLTRQESHDRTKEPGDRIARLVYEDGQS